MGPSDDTRRDVGVPQSWRGLSLRDRAVLSAWLNRPGMSIDELHTDVPVGEISSELRVAAGEISQAQLEAMYALRIDALVRTNGERLVVECKPYANAHALGQVLTYQRMLFNLCPEWRETIACVCCCGIDDSLRAVYVVFGIRSIVVGQVLRV